MPDQPLPVCQLCGGAGRIVTSSLKAYLCRCVRKEKLRLFLGPEIYNTPLAKKSPLYEPGVDISDEPLVDRTVENLFIKSRWHSLLGHLKLAIGCRYWRSSSPFRYLIVTDERLFNVWIGHEHARHKSRDDTERYNSLRDLLVPINLVVIRLDFFGHKNVAAPGVLKQALLIRETELLPTWIVQSPNTTPISWNDDVNVYVREHFDVVTISDEPPGAQVQAPTIEVHDVAVEAKEDLLSDLVPANPEEVKDRRGKFKPGSVKKRRWGGSGGGENNSGPLEGNL